MAEIGTTIQGNSSKVDLEDLQMMRLLVGEAHLDSQQIIIQILLAGVLHLDKRRIIPVLLTGPHLLQTTGAHPPQMTGDQIVKQRLREDITIRDLAQDRTDPHQGGLPIMTIGIGRGRQTRISR